MVAIAVTNNTTTAQLGSGSPLGITGSLSVSATHGGSTTATADASANGDSVAVGAALALALANDTTTSTTEPAVQAGESVSFMATGAASSSAQATASAGGAQGQGSNTPSSGVDQQVAVERGFADGIASADGANTSGSTATPEAQTGDGSVSVAAAVGVNVENSTVQALIPTAGSVMAGGLLLLSATNATAGLALADGSETDENGNPKVGVGAAVALNLVNTKNQATIGSGAQVKAQGVTIEALRNSGSSLPVGVTDGTNTFSAQATSGAGASNVDVAGAVALNLLTDTNQPLIEQNSGTATTSVDTLGGNVILTAQDNSVITAQATSIATGGKVGVGASAALNVVLAPGGADTAQAKVQDGVALTKAADVAITATSEQTLTSAAQAGSAGATAVKPSLAVVYDASNATAYLGSGATLQASGDISITATDTTTTTTTGGGYADSSGKVGAGVSVALNIVESSANAALGRGISAGAPSASLRKPPRPRSLRPRPARTAPPLRRVTATAPAVPAAVPHPAPRIPEIRTSKSSICSITSRTMWARSWA